jgi:hypothetical protein
MNNDVMNLHKKVVNYLAEIKVVPQNVIPDGAHDDSIAREAMKEMGVSSPVARMKAVGLNVGYPLVQDPTRIQEYVSLFKL